MTTRSKRSAKKLGTAAILSFSLVAAACGGGSSDSTPDDTPDATEAPDATTAPDAEEPDAAPANTADAAVVIDESDVVEEDAGPVAGGTLRYGLEADVNGINPATSSLSSPGLMMGNAVYDTLAAFTPDGQWVPYLAESFTPNDDFSQWQVKLREGISFHDGTPLNAAAVQTNFETQRGDPLVGLAVKPFFPAENATELIDDLTIQFNLAEPNVVFPGSLAGQLGMVASPAWLAAALVDPTLNQEPVGTGPFIFDSRSQDSITKFVRNDAWWGGEVYLDAIEFIPVTDPDTRNDLLFNGELDALQTTNPASVGDLQAEDGFQNVIDENGEESFGMINTAVPPFDDIRAREALTQATPLQNYRDLIGLGISRAADQSFVPESKYYNPDVVQQGDNPERALELVAEYCADKGTDVNTTLGETTTCTDGRINIELQWSGPAVVQTRIAEILDEGWKNAGFNVTFDELPQDEHILQTAIGQYNVVTWRQFGATDPAQDNVWLMCRTIGGISLNWPKFCDESRDALLLEAQASQDDATRVALYQELQQKINADFTYIFFLHTTWDNAFGENVRGVCDRLTPEGEATQCATGGRTWFSSVYFAA
ncbi:ABC transporter substrate-binding protein [Ilumatobacter sp.]|uniref:ABC transporter substrate-binding protein n=1 Tax=Ilumatobacter sp. TaxID=1967498 RepID=UPI0037538B1D